MKQILVIFEINGKRQGYKGNQYCAERFFKALLLTGTKIQFINTYKLGA